MSLLQRINQILFLVLLTGFLVASLYWDRAGYAALFGLFLGTALERMDAERS